MDAAKRIRQYIEDNGIKQSFVAERAGISQPVFYAIMNGQTKLSVERLEAISKALGMKPEFFLNQNS